MARLALLPAVALGLTLLAGCGEQPAEAGAVRWERLPDLPLAEREGPVVAWTGEVVLAVGGDTGEECPPTADCEQPNAAATDGAALDPATGTWRAIADAPRPVPAYSSSALVGDELFVHVDRALLVYDTVRDRWRVLPRRVDGWYRPVADGDRLVLVHGSDEQRSRPDLVLDPATGRWARLPDDPLGPSFDRTVVSTPPGLLLGAHDLVDSPGAGADPSYLRAALLDRETGEWRTFGPSGQLGAPVWAAVGDRVVGLSLETSDGGGPEPGDYGRDVPLGGRLDLVSGKWSALPSAPDPESGGWPVLAAGEHLVAASGFVYDDASAAWTALPRPDGAAEGAGPAVWAGERLVVVTGRDRGDTHAETRSNEVWIATVG